MGRQEPILVKGKIRDKQQLIKIAAHKAKTEKKFSGNVTIVSLSEYDPEIEGYVVVVEEADS